MWSWKYLELNENLIKNLIVNLGVDDYLIKLMFTVYSSFLFWIGFLFILIHALSLSFHALSHFPLNHCFLFLLFIKWDIFLVRISWGWNPISLACPLVPSFLSNEFHQKNSLRYSLLLHDSSFSLYMNPFTLLPYLP